MTKVESVHSPLHINPLANKKFMIGVDHLRQYYTYISWQQNNTHTKVWHVTHTEVINDHMSNFSSSGIYSTDVVPH